MAIAILQRVRRRSADLAKTADRRSPGFVRPMRLAQARLHAVFAFRETTGR